jgi:hypothetical protein
VAVVELVARIELVAGLLAAIDPRIEEPLVGLALDRTRCAAVDVNGRDEGEPPRLVLDYAEVMVL